MPARRAPGAAEALGLADDVDVEPGEEPDVVEDHHRRGIVERIAQDGRPRTRVAADRDRDRAELAATPDPATAPGRIAPILSFLRGLTGRLLFVGARVIMRLGRGRPRLAGGATSVGAALLAAAVRVDERAPANRHTRLAALRLAREEPESAVLACRRGLALHPDEPWLHFHLGRSLDASGDRDGASATFRRAVELDPGEVAFAHELDRLVDGPEVAAPHLDVARGLADAHPASWLVHRHLGHTLTVLERYDEAACAFHRSTAARVAAEPVPGAAPRDADGPLPPGLLVIGARRCGKTTLFGHLCRHPRIVPGLREEINFWSHQYDRGLDWYLSLFPWLRPESGVITAHTSARYLHDADAPGRLRADLPDVRIVVALRNPVDRARADHHQATAFGQERRNWSEVVDNWLSRPDAVADPGLPAYLRNGIYAPSMERWLTVFPRNQVLVVPSEELFAQPGRVVDEVCGFLGLDPLPGPVPRAKPDAEIVADTSMSDDLRRDLAAFYSPHNRRLETILGRSLGWS